MFAIVPDQLFQFAHGGIEGYTNVERIRIAYDKAPKQTMCIVSHGG